ncbi:hypothetical protein [Flavobacterium sp.]|uniref:hypothetical protein n=1 Tax=Flavobacterium sp. TaxID=239 RepID=UPI00261182B2|nr:hypothetical protein [Flavobacterium sp.]MDD2987147.1 hypothetical protein [Flavobacterium sp.]
MAKKKINIILLIIVIGLWGSVTYRFAKPYFIANDIGTIAKSAPTYSDTKMPFKDTFEMKTIQRDPFLNRLVNNPTVSKVKYPLKTGSPILKKEPTVKKPVPFIEYYGYIKSGSGQGKELIMIKNNGVLFKLKLGEEREGLKVLKIFKDSVQFSFNKEKYFVRKK